MNARIIVSPLDPFEVTLVADKSKTGSLANRPVMDIPQTQIHPLDRNKDTCLYVEVDQFGSVVKKCYNRVHVGRHGFLCKMHHDLNVKMKPQHRTIYMDESDLNELALINKMKGEVEVARYESATVKPDMVTVDYTSYVQWGWIRQPMLFIENGFGEIEQGFYDPFEEVEVSS